MAIYGSEVWNVQALEHLTGRQNHSNTFLNSFNRFINTLADNRCMLENTVGSLAQILIGLAQPDFGEIFCQRPLSRVYCHRVVVEYNKQLPLDQPEIIECLKGGAINDTGIADQHHDFISV